MAADSDHPSDAPVRGRGAGTRQVRVEPGGPVLVEGPVEISGGDGATETVDRFLVAICACGHSDRYPLCDGSHRSLRSG